MFVTEKAIGETARRFKTADELGLPKHLYTALLRVREGFISGEITEDRFDMTAWNIPTSNSFLFDGFVCGSVCCIGGWMDVLGNYDTLSFINNYWPRAGRGTNKRRAKGAKALYYLTHPPMRSMCWDQITIKDAIKAIDNFLTTGDSSWQTVRSDLSCHPY